MLSFPTVDEGTTHLEGLSILIQLVTIPRTSNRGVGWLAPSVVKKNVVLTIGAVVIGALEQKLVSLWAHFVVAGGYDPMQIDRQALSCGPQPVGLGV